MNGRTYWLGVAAAFGIGVITGVAGVRVELEKKLRSEFSEREELMQHAYEQALDLQREWQAEAKPAASEEELNLDGDLDEAIEGLDFDAKDSVFGEGVLTEGGNIVEVKDSITGETITTKSTENPYHKAVAATETTQEMFVAGGVNDYGVSYIEEEDYLDEDGRFKGKIDIIMDDHNPVFLMDGQPIDDWDKRVGDSILVDFYKLVPPGVDPVLYVRNHRTDEDYEVVRVVQT
jgi:hypothetical protein